MRALLGFLLFLVAPVAIVAYFVVQRRKVHPKTTANIPVQAISAASIAQAQQTLAQLPPSAVGPVVAPGASGGTVTAPISSTSIGGVPVVPPKPPPLLTVKPPLNPNIGAKPPLTVDPVVSEAHVPVISVPTFDPDSPHPPLTVDQSAAQSLTPIKQAVSAIPVVGSLAAGAVGVAQTLTSTLSNLLGGGPGPYSQAQLDWINGDPLKAAAINGGQTAVESMVQFAAAKPTAAAVEVGQAKKLGVGVSGASALNNN